MIKLTYSGLDTQSHIPTHRYLLMKDNETVGNGGIRTKTSAAGDIVYDILSSFRGQGYGTLLLKLLLQEAKKQGLKEAILVCKKENLASKAIIEKNGGEFVEETARKNKQNRLKYRITL